MKREEIKKLMLESLKENGGEGSWNKLQESGVDYSFRAGFQERVMDRLFTAGVVVNREIEFARSWNTAFLRIALTGVAAIIILLVSIYLAEGSFSFNSILGLSDSYNESIVCLLTGN
ncbi:MAG: hypothetical protein U0T33_01380 [Bacteroidales bacterium]